MLNAHGLLLFAVILSHLVPHPYRVFSHAAHVGQLQDGSRIVAVLYPVEHGGHALAPVDVRAHHEAYLVQQSGGEECGVDVSAADYGEAVYSELAMQYLHCAPQVYAVSAAGYPRYALRRQVVVVLSWASLVGYYQQVVFCFLVAPQQCAVCVYAYFILPLVARIVPCFAAYGRWLSALNVPGSAVCFCIDTRPSRQASH